MREKKINVFRDPLDVVFRHIPPEALIESIKMGSDCKQRADVKEIDKNLFDRCAQANMGDLTPDEVDLIWKMTIQQMHPNSARLCEQEEPHSDPLIFHLLTNFTRDVLEARQDDPVYQITKALSWRDISHRLGQDLFTTAHIAEKDAKSGFTRTYFAWPLVLHSDDSRLRSLMENGCAENHYHLEGSVPVFHLSWACLMNHPEDAFRFERSNEQISQLFRYNLEPTKQFSAREQQLTWSERVLIAAWIRAMLFRRLEGIDEGYALKCCYERLKEEEDNKAEKLLRMLESYCGTDERRRAEALVSTTDNGKLQEQLLHRIIRDKIDAAKLEHLFFQFIENNVGENNVRWLCQLVQHLRRDFGNKELVYNRQQWCLDYADTTADQRNRSLNRLLVGERYFLYRCIRECFLGKESRFERAEQNLFYLYLLIKARLRSELVQVNNRPGFRNFRDYQNRKSDIWKRYPEYIEYAYRIAVNQTIQDNHLCSLEARISPPEKPERLAEYIYRVDRTWLETRERMNLLSTPDNQGAQEDGDKAPRLRERRKPMSPAEIRSKMEELRLAAESGKTHVPDFFYVLHFSKTPLPDIPDKDEVTELPVRHHLYRGKVYRQTMSIARALEMDPYLCTRIRGLDAAASEIGCRPENFATEYRFLYNYTVPSRPLKWYDSRSRSKPLLGMTYHVGEDFQTVEDGLRAIDEAVCFLNLKRGSRLGHALAIGVDPELHYRRKGVHILECKQDRLDNLVWLLFRSSEWSVSIPSDLRTRMTCQAEALLSELYGHTIQNHAMGNLHNYYEAWKLRGDHPDIIRSKLYGADKSPNRFCSHTMEQYQASKENPFFQNTGVSNGMVHSEIQIQLAYAYLYDRKSRYRGQKVVAASTEAPYLKLIREMQEQMLRKLNEQGIAIESNPSSNLLIGSFDRYDSHPVFLFNNDGLSHTTSPGQQMNVSINTDDQGVFATSLENEYALLASAMYRKTDENGERLYSDHTVLSYLEHLQSMGIRQVFPASK